MRYVVLAAAISCVLNAAAFAQPREIRCPCIADTTVSIVPPNGPTSSGGGLDRIVAESNLRYALFKFDMRELAGLKITEATLRLRRIEHLLVRAGVSTVAGDWREGVSKEFHPEPGAACYRYATNTEDERFVTWWAAAGSDLSDAVFGGGGSRWAAVVPAFDKDSLWYEIDVPPALAQAVAQGLQPGGFCLSDDFGRTDTAPTFWSRESSSPPELVVHAERAEPVPSAAPSSVRATRDELGLDWVEFEAPQALGFEVYLAERPLNSDADLSAAQKLDIWALPTAAAGPLDALISFHRRATDRVVAVRAVESAASWSAFTNAELPPPIQSNPALPDLRLPRHPLPAEFDRPFTMHDGAVLSEDARWIHSAAQTWWNPFEGPITLEAGRNEFVAFQVVFAGGPGAYSVLLADWRPPGAASPAPQSALYLQRYIRSRLGQEKFAPDALMPLENGASVPLTLLTPAAASQPVTQPTRRPIVQPVWVELYVPHGTATGVWRTRVVALRDGVALLDVPIELNIVAPTLPDTLQFTVCLDAEQTPAQACGLPADAPDAWTLLEAYHRLAHQHRATLAVIPYAPLGRTLAGFAPPIQFDAAGVAQFDWTDWDARFARYFDGGAFRDLPRAGVPVSVFYLPFHEAWPLPFAPKKAAPRARLAEKYHFRPTWTERTRTRVSSPRSDDYLVWPVEAAFPPEHAAQTQAALQGFAAHLAERFGNAAGPKRGATKFHLFLHNRAGDARGSSWWHFDPPQIHDDVLALRHWLRHYAAALGAQPAAAATSPAAPATAPGGRTANEARDRSIHIRASCSNPMIQRDALDGLADITVADHASSEEYPTLAAQGRRYGELWSTAGEVSPELGWATVYKWVWGAALSGARGVHVPDSLGDAGSWQKADDTAFLYPGAPAGVSEPLPSLRLKALCRAQQDIEWLEAWIAAQRARGTPRGYALAIAGAALIDRSQSRTPNWTTVLPVVRFPGDVDTVAFEEVRRMLRGAAAQ